ncbi:MAG TPA: aromatic hydrocarbon degradation protein [Puia sp.]
MQKTLTLLSLFLCQQLSAQIPEDALRSAWTVPNGTARQQAIGGAMGSLGGEISSAFVNPAGLGVFKTSEFVLSPGFRFLTDKSNYLNGTSSGKTANNFNLGTSGLVIAYTGRNGGSNVFSMAVNRMANFNSNVYYKGENDYSSGSEQYVEEFAASGLSIDQGLSSPSLSYGTRMALYTYLIDTATINGNLQVIGQPQKAGRVWQENNLQSRGGITEIAFSLATNLHDKWYIGGSLGIPIINYTRYQTYHESDATGNPNNDFDSYTYQETFTSKGWGLNGKLGVIFKPAAAWRIGLALHTPTMYGLTDKINASMITRTENYTSHPQASISSDSLDQMAGISPANTVSYNLYTPWRFIFSGSYIFGSGEADVRQQKGFVTADLEYSTNGSPRFKPANNNGQGQTDYYNAVNAGVKSSYKGSLGMRLGGELKFNTLMARAGFAYYTTPYKDKALTADRLFLSGGLGYRNRGMFVDLTYIMGFSRDVNFPYRLSDKANTVATLKENGGTIVATVGFKF